jgi:hypothetical protein
MPRRARNVSIATAAWRYRVKPVHANPMAVAMKSTISKIAMVKPASIAR